MKSLIMLKKIKLSIEFLSPFVKSKPIAGIVLGTGLGGFEKSMKTQHKIAYKDIPYFPTSTVEGHEGNLIIGEIKGKQVVALQGRFHFYEGYSMQEIIYPIRVLKLLGIKYLFVSNASGGMNPKFKIGDIMLIIDHINLMPNPLIGPHEPIYGPRFPDMSKTYDNALVEKAEEIAYKNEIKIFKGCYVAVTGPTFETPKEYEYFRLIGGDNIGMSTVPEVIAAVQMGIKCLAISVITDLGIPGKITEISHEEVQKAAKEAEWKISLIIKDVISGLKIS